MEKQERIPGDQTKRTKGEEGELNFKLNLLFLYRDCIARRSQKHLVCLQIISNMFSLSRVAFARSPTELNLHVILAVVHMC